jgi:ankyrin repeat protein
MTRRVAKDQQERGAKTTKNINPLIRKKPLTGETRQRLTEKLIMAAADGKTMEAKKLLSEGADINGEGSDWPPIVMAAVNRHIEMALLLGMKGADLEAKDNLEGRTAMHWAALNGFYECVVSLENLGAEKDVRDGMGKSPLDLAKENRHYQVVEFLEER